MNDIAIFDLDGTLIDLKIDRSDFERCRSYWASYLTARGISTTLEPLLPELKRISQTSLGSGVRADIIRTFDDLELTSTYRLLGGIDALLSTVKLKFRKLALVTHNSSALWARLTQENTWTRLMDTVITRDDTDFFKPDPRVCEVVFKGLGCGEFWVVGNSEADLGLGLNLRRKYSDRVVRTFMVNPTVTGGTTLTGQLDVTVPSVDSLLNLMQDVPA